MYELYYELKKLLWRLLCWDGSQRPSAEECLKCDFFKVGGFVPHSTKRMEVSLLQNPSHPVVQVDRSCESLSSCLQLNNLPAKPILRSPIEGLSKNPLTPPLHGTITIAEESQPKGHRKTLSVDERLLSGSLSESTGVSSRRHKHKRIDSTPMSCVLSPSMVKSPTGVNSTPTLSMNGTPVMAKDQLTARQYPVAPLVLTSHSASKESDLLLSLPPKVLTDDDYRTPPPSLFQHIIRGRSPRAPLFGSGDETPAADSSIRRQSIVPPPSFDEVSSSQIEQSTEISSPQQIPLSLCTFFRNASPPAQPGEPHPLHNREIAFEKKNPSSFGVLS